MEFFPGIRAEWILTVIVTLQQVLQIPCFSNNMKVSQVLRPSAHDFRAHLVASGHVESAPRTPVAARPTVPDMFGSGPCNQAQQKLTIPQTVQIMSMGLANSDGFMLRQQFNSLT